VIATYIADAQDKAASAPAPNAPGPSTGGSSLPKLVQSFIAARGGGV
jgi:hypothetical protein